MPRGTAIVFIGERYLFRYGADRSILEIAKEIQKIGIDTFLVGIDFSTPPDIFSDKIIRVPRRSFAEQKRKAEGDVYPHLQNLSRRYETLLVVVWSWPFLHLLKTINAYATHSTFLDFGVVPDIGYPPKIIKLLSLVRSQRKKYIGYADKKMAISDYIATTQTIPDGGNAGTYTNYLGDNHAKFEIDEKQISLFEVWQRKSFLPVLSDLLEKQKSDLIFALGRYEPFTYKNSQITFEIADNLLNNQYLLRLGGGDYLGKKGGRIIDIGYPSDAELFFILSKCNLAVSTSLWEGFNLPIVESGKLKTPVYALDVGPHKEVINRNDRLFTDSKELIDSFRSIHEHKPFEGFGRDFPWYSTATNLLLNSSIE